MTSLTLDEFIVETQDKKRLDCDCGEVRSNRYFFLALRELAVTISAGWCNLASDVMM
ncbi:MAG: hypothetical protein M3539_09580 [Acidobacteriota bacterium]|nr:hypothetical protein [Acidobacteriota bacterium]